MKYKRVLLMLIGLLLISPKVYANGNEILLPIRDYFESNGFEVKWNDELMNVEILDEDKSVISTFGKSKFEIPYVFIGEKTFFNLKDFNSVEIEDEFKSSVVKLVDFDARDDEDIPNFVFVEDGKIQDFHNTLCTKEITAVLFYADWCPNCDGVLKLFDTEFDKLSELNVNLFAISIDNELNQKYQIPILHDPEIEVFKAFKGEYVPTLYLVEDKNISQVLVGQNEISQFINNLVK